MKVYTTEICVGSYEILAIGDTPENAIKALVREYHSRFGSFRENGFKNQADWLEWHGVSPEGCRAIKINSAITK